MQADVGVQVRKACLLDYRIPREAELDLRLLDVVDEDSFRPILQATEGARLSPDIIDGFAIPIQPQELVIRLKQALRAIGVRGG